MNYYDGDPAIEAINILQWYFGHSLLWVFITTYSIAFSGWLFIRAIRNAERRKHRQHYEKLNALANRLDRIGK